jgi:hypothetical protein
MNCNEYQWILISIGFNEYQWIWLNMNEYRYQYKWKLMHINGSKWISIDIYKWIYIYICMYVHICYKYIHMYIRFCVQTWKAGYYLRGAILWWNLCANYAQTMRIQPRHVWTGIGYVRLINSNIRWISTNINEYQCASMNSNEYHWILMNFNEYKWVSMNINEY